MDYEVQDSVKELGSNASSIRKKTVSIVGLGGIGSNVAELLARAGVNLRLIDKDRVYESDMTFLSLFSQDHLLKFKAKETKKLLENINKDIKVKAFHEELTETNAYLVDADVIIDCSNDLKTSLLVDKAAKKKPVIYARAIGCEGHVFIANETRLKDVSDFLEKMIPDNKKSPVLGSTTRMTASIVVNKALKLLTGSRFEKNYLVFNAWKLSLDKKPVRKNSKKSKK